MDFVSLIQLILTLMVALVGYPSLVSVIATALEYFKWLDPANSDKFLFWSNAVAFVGLFALAVTGKLDLVNQIDLALGNLARLLTYLLILLGVPSAFAISRAQHKELIQSSGLRAR